MPFLFFRKRVIGLEFGQSRLRLVEMEKRGRRVRVTNMASADGVQAAPEGNTLPDRDELKQAITTLIEDNRIRAKKVYFVIPNQQVLVRFLRLPPAPPRVMRSLVAWKLSNELEVPFADPVFDFLVLPRDAAAPAGTEEDGLVEVMIVAAPRSLVVDFYADLLAEVGLTPVAAEAKSTAILRVLELLLDRDSLTAGNLAVVEANSRDSDLILYYNGVARLARNVVLGAKSQSLVETDLERYPFAELATQMEKLLAFSRVSSRGRNRICQYLIILGDDSPSPLLREELSRRFDLTLLPLDPAALLSGPAEKLTISFPSLVTAMGAGLRVLGPKADRARRRGTDQSLGAPVELPGMIS